MSVWTLLLAAVGLAMLLEGLPYFAFPAGVRRYMEQITRMSDPTLRLLGLALMTIGLLVLYLTLH